MKLTIPGGLTDLNTYTRYNRANKYGGGQIKKEETERVYFECKRQNISPIAGKVNIFVKHFVKNYRKDEDNVTFSIKFLMDGLVLAGVIKNDSPAYCHIAQNEVFYGNGEKIEVELLPAL
jgi:Holliday junction resolvase RusA-like endonuclease